MQTSCGRLFAVNSHNVGAPFPEKQGASIIVFPSGPPLELTLSAIVISGGFSGGKWSSGWHEQVLIVVQWFVLGNGGERERERTMAALILDFLWE